MTRDHSSGDYHGGMEVFNGTDLAQRYSIDFFDTPALSKLEDQPIFKPL
jgi:hypothetical protein